MNLLMWSTMSDLFQVMPVIVVDLKVPATLEDGMDRLMSRARRLRRRFRIGWSRKLAMLRYGLRGVVENFKKTEDDKPILKREGRQDLLTCPSFNPLFLGGHVGFTDVDLTSRT